MTPELLDFLASTSGDPLAFVLGAFPWGEPGELEDFDGPEPWQRDILAQIRDGLSFDAALKLAIASGHGIGKSALVAWLVLWAICTLEGTNGVVTANTETQLKTKTWAEVSRWYRRCIAREMFEMTATSIYSKDPDFERTWRIDMVPWSETRPESFAGLHNKGKRILVIFDEGAAIPSIIYETAEGALTDANTQIVWFVAGNPTKNTGKFKELFQRKDWITRQIDARQVSIGNKTQYNAWIEAYGEDSDFVRIRVLGKFPRAGSLEFISQADVDAALAREVDAYSFDPLIMGVDVARFGDDASVIYFRKGRDARTIPALEFRGLDLMSFAGRVAELCDRHKPSALFVDEGGVGGGVIDRLRQLGISCVGINFGSSPDRSEPNLYANKRAEIWGLLRDWLKTGALARDGIEKELIGPTYGFNAANAIQLERKQDMKKRGLASPDRADALALTFAYPVLPKFTGLPGDKKRGGVESEYNPFEMLERA